MILRVIFLIFYLLPGFYSYGNDLKKEEILKYHVTLRVDENGVLNVDERIAVVSLGKIVKSGITKTFPWTSYLFDGSIETMLLKVDEISKDGNKIPYIISKDKSFHKIITGTDDNLLEKGIHNYHFKYKVFDRVSYLEDSDALTWEAISSEIDLDVDLLITEVFLPDEAGALNFNAKTNDILSDKEIQGKYSRERGAIVFTHRNLSAKNFVKININWPRGYINYPTISKRLVWIYIGNESIRIFVFAVFIIFAFYILTWVLVGIDPIGKKRIIPSSKVMEKLSPASVGFLSKMALDESILFSTILGLLSKGYVEFHKINGEDVLKRTYEQPDGADEEEKLVYQCLFPFKESKRLTLNDYPKPRVRDAFDELERYLKKNI